MKVTIRATALALAACAAAGSAAAVEGYTPYDNFQVSPLDPARWQDAERSRMINGGANLRLVQRDWGATTSDSGAAPGISWSETIARGGPVTQLRATLKVAAVDVTGCAANPTTSNVRGRVLGSFFNSGNRSAGSSVGDVLAQVWATRASNSADAPGVLRVEGWLGICTSSDCSTSTQIGSTVALGTVNVNTNVVLQVDWDRENKQFLFSRDKGAATAVSYAGIDDSADPGAVFKNVSTRTVVANCASGPRAYGYIDARFDNVQVNAGAKP
jgi:hypothetical protein